MLHGCIKPSICAKKVYHINEISTKLVQYKHSYNFGVLFWLKGRLGHTAVRAAVGSQSSSQGTILTTWMISLQLYHSLLRKKKGYTGTNLCHDVSMLST